MAFEDFGFKFKGKDEISGSVKNMKKAFVDLNGSTTKADKGMASFYKTLRKTDLQMGNMSKDANRASDSIKGLTKSFSGLNQVMGMAKIYAIGTAMAQTIKSSLDMIETTNLFSVSLGDMAEATDEVVNKLTEAYGLDPTNVRNAVGTYALLAKSMGMTSQQASTLSTNMYQLALDYSSLTNVPIQQVLEDFRSGLLGQSETVYKYGIDVTEAGLQAEAMAQGIDKSVREMSQGEKMALRYNTMIRTGSIAMGDFAKTINTPANQLRILQEQFVQLARLIGALVLPALGAILPYLNAILGLAIKGMQSLLAMFGIKLPEVKNFKNTSGMLEDMENSANGTASGLDKASKSAKAMKSAMLGIDELNVIPDQSTGDTGDSGNGGLGIGGASDMSLLNPYDALLDRLKDVNSELEAKILPVLKQIALVSGIVAGSFLGWKLFGFMKGLKEAEWFIALGSKITEVFHNIIWGIEKIKYASFGDTLSTAFKAVTTSTAGVTIIITAIVGAIIYLWNTSEEFRNSWIQVWGNLMEILKNVWERVVKPIFEALAVGLVMIWEGGLKPLWIAWTQIWFQISGVLTTVLNQMLPLINILVIMFSTVLIPVIQFLLVVFSGVFTGILGIVTGVFNSIAGVIEGVKNIFQGVIKYFKGAFAGDWRMVWEGLVQIFKGIFGAIGSIIYAPLNAIIDGVNGVIRGLNKMKVPDWVPAIGGQGISLSVIPRLARGGQLDAGQAFIAGEAGAELIGSYQGKTTVMPLENTDFVQAIHDAVLSAMTAGSGGQVIENVLTLDGEVIYANQQKVARNRGKDFGMGAFSR